MNVLVKWYRTFKDSQLKTFFKIGGVRARRRQILGMIGFSFQSLMVNVSLSIKADRLEILDGDQKNQT